MKNLLTFSLLTAMLAACSSISDMPQKPGACFIKVEMPTVYDTVLDSVTIYTGSDPAAVTDTLFVITQEEKVQWKKVQSKDCTSALPDDCLVWCKVSVPEQRDTFITVDTMLTDEFIWKVALRSIVVDEGGYMEWHETVCGNLIDAELNKRMQQKLIALGYDVGKEVPDGVWDKTSSLAMKYFVEDQNLPVGNAYLLIGLGALGIDEYISYYEEFLARYK